MMLKKHFTGFLLFSFAFLICFALSTLAVSCTATKGKNDAVSKAVKSGAPGWLIMGCEPYFRSTGNPKPCGVGYAANDKNPLSRDLAANRARAELAKNIRVKVESVLQNEQSGGSLKYGESEAIIEATKQVTEASLAGSKPVDSWTDEDGTLYILVVIEPNVFRSTVSSSQGLPENIRNAIQQGY